MLQRPGVWKYGWCAAHAAVPSRGCFFIALPTCWTRVFIIRLGKVGTHSLSPVLPEGLQHCCRGQRA